VVSPPSDASQGDAVSTPPNRPAGTGTLPESQAATARTVAAAAVESADIRPLDLAGALQILIAEVRAELTRVLLEATDIPAPADTDTRTYANATATANIDAVASAARGILEAVMNSLPQSSRELAVWSDALPRIDAAVELGMARALAIIDTWRDVPGPVVTGARELHALVTNALSDEPLNALWLRSEGLNLAPRLTRLRRRRKLLHRRLTDPDYRPSFFDDPEPLT
jgi:hypothetical protein